MTPPQPAFLSGALCPKLPSKHARQTLARPAQTPRMGRRSEKIKGRKDAQNMARAKVFARIGKMITMAAKAGGPDVVANRALADAIETAKAASFPKDTMEKAIARATSADQADYKESTFEAYGHGGAAIYIDVLTDNSNRAAADIRTAINKSKLKIASPGSVTFNFERMGVVRVEADSVADPDELFLSAIDAGAEECELDAGDDALYRILTEPGVITSTQKALEAAGYKVDLARVEMVAKNTVQVSEADMLLNQKGIDMIEALEDVDGVFTNAVCA